MNTYTFRISTFSDNPIFPVSKDKWDEEIITEKTSGIILVKICSDGWNEVFNRPPEYQCNGFDFAQFFHWLQTARNLHGYSIDPERYSPAQLYEALSMSWKYPFSINGDVPNEPFSNPDSDLEKNGYGELSWKMEHNSHSDEKNRESFQSAQVSSLCSTEENSMNIVYEDASISMDIIEKEVRAATTFGQIEELFRRVFNLSSSQQEEHQNEESDYGLKVRGKGAREKINAQCREILSRVNSADEITPKDRQVLLQYSGRGGLTENSQYEYYTPTFVAEGVWDAMRANGFKNGNVLDPCCGAGVFEGTKPAGVVVTGNDLDPTSSQIAALLNPTDSISTQPFERLAVNTPDNTFDSCVTNVPFGDARGASMHEDPAFKKEKQIERYFILRILDKIRPGGLACLVCPINIVGAKGKKWEEFRIAVSKKAEFLGAHKLPSKTFNAQGTDTVVDVVVFRKHGADFLTSVDETPFEVLKATKVVWEPFVKGDYWKGEGKPFIMGRYIPKAAGDRWSREEVQGEIDSTAIKQKLAQKFHSRIDWEALSLVEPITRNYGEGDKRIINGEPHTMIAGEWIKDAIDSTPTAIDPKKYGAESLEQLEGILSGDKGGLSLSLENMFSIYKSYPAILSPLQKEAVEFAMGQPKAPLREQLYRGVILGGLLARMSSKSDAGEDVTADRTALQELVVADLERFGHPKNNKGLVLAGEGSRMFGLFKNAVDEQGNFSDLLAGTLDK